MGKKSGGDGGAGAAQLKAIEALEKVNLPDIEKMKILLQDPAVVAQLQAEAVGPTELSKIQIDPRIRDAQMQALEMLRQRGQGLTAEDRMDFRSFADAAAAEEQSSRASDLARDVLEGRADSGTSIFRQEAERQANAQRMSNKASEMARAALENKRNSLAQLGQLSNQMGAQEFSQQAQQRSAQDTINQFNTANRMNVQQQNLGERQRIADTRTDLANQQQMFNKGLYQQQFQNEMAKAGGISNQYQNQAQQLAQAAQARSAGKQSMMGGLMQAGATIGAAYMTGGASLAADPKVQNKVKGG